MSPVAAGKRSRRTARSGKGYKHPGRFAQMLRWWWPLLLAFLAMPFAVRAASVLVLTGPGALRFLYPFVMLVQMHGASTWAGSLAPEQHDMLAQWMMWAQFPLYGLIASLVGIRRGIAAGLGAVLLLHAGAVLAAILFTPVG